MKEKLEVINSILTSILMLLCIYLAVQLAVWLPKISVSKYRLNNAQCLESYKYQNQPPLGACGFDFELK